MKTLTLVLAALMLSSPAAAPAPARRLRTAYSLSPVLNVPLAVHIAAPRSDPHKLYVVQQDGYIRVAVDGRLRAKPFLDVSGLVSSKTEQGLLSIAFHPAFAKNRRFYVDYTDTHGDTRVVELRANRDGTVALPGSARRLLFVAQPGSEHNGGQLAFGPDGKLYVGMGDGGCCDDPMDRAQNMGSLLGKLLRLDPGRPGAPTIAGLGLRNPWRFSFDRATGDLYIGDVGAGLWEEVDYVPRAQLGTLANYGWDVWEGPAVKEAKPRNPQGRLVGPLQAYPHDPECSITGGFVYRGSAVPEARGRYFYGDYCSGAVWSLRVADGVATDVRREPFDVPKLSTFGEDARGELYAASISGRIFKLVK
jgi:glucose/arabinose dehydrogenase